MDYLKINQVISKILTNYKETIINNNINIVKLCYNKNLIELQLTDDNLIKQEWTVKKTEFYKYF